MTTLKLGYGRGAVSFDYDAARFRLLEMQSEEGARPLTDVDVGAALDEPIDSRPLEEIVSAGETVLIVVSDATRATASAQVVNLLVRRLIESGVSPGDIRIIFATGIHRPVTAEEKRELLTPFIAQRIKTLDHSASDPSSMIRLGETGRGTPVEINRML